MITTCVVSHSKRKARAVNRDRKKRIVCAASQTLKKRKSLAESRDLKRGGCFACLFFIFVGGNMEQLKLYRISDRYIRFLKSRDHRVQDNKNRSRPYVGVVLLVGNYKYFVPMESPKPSHAKIKPGHHIMRLDNGNLGLLGFNNMIPVPEEAIICFNIDDEPDLKYAELLRRQVSFINRHKADVFDHASKTYYGVVTKKTKFLVDICCDFRNLERACSKYDPNHQPARRSQT